MQSTPRPPEELSSGSSDSETEEKNIFGPPPSKTSQWNNRQSQRSTADQRADRAENTPVSQGLDRELQAFISMRDQTDEATEVTENMLYTTDAVRGKKHADSNSSVYRKTGKKHIFIKQSVLIWVCNIQESICSQDMSLKLLNLYNLCKHLVD